MSVVWPRVTPGPGVSVERSHGLDVVVFLSAFLVLLVCLPSRLVLAPLGAVGTPATVLGILAAVWWATSRIVPHLGGAMGRQPVRLALAVFATAMLIGYTSGMLRPLVGVETRSADRFMLALIGWCGIALLCADGVTTRARCDVLVRRIVLAGAFLASLGLVQFATGLDVAQLVHLPGLHENAPVESIQVRSSFRRVAGTALHPIEFGVVLAMVLPLALSRALSSALLRDRLPVLLIAFALPMSLSRSAVLGTAAAMAVLMAGWSWRRRLNVLAVIVLMLAVQRAAIPGLLGTLKSLFVYIGVDPSTTGRTDDYAQVWEMVLERPLFGRGTGTYVPSVYRILDNQYLITLLEAGLFGVLALVGLLLTGMTCARGARQRSVDPATHELGQALCASLTVALVSFVTFDAFSFPMVSGLLFLLLGTTGALWRLERGSSLRQVDGASPISVQVVPR